MPSFRLRPRGPFSLAQSIELVRGFGPVAEPQPAVHRLRLGFTDDSGLPCALSVRQDGGQLGVDYVSDLPPEAVERHAARLLSVDVDGEGLAELGARDPVIGRLQQRFPGRRQVCFGTHFEAAVWALLSQRTRMTAAARLRERLQAELGFELEIDGATVPAFPGPDRLAAAGPVEGLPQVKLERLRRLAEAAADGQLDPVALRALPARQALARLQELPGIGPFSASLVLIRGAGHPDVTPTAERRLARAAARAYGRPEAELDEAELERIAEGWRPYRSWVAFLMRNLLDEETARRREARPLGSDRSAATQARPAPRPSRRSATRRRPPGRGRR